MRKPALRVRSGDPSVSFKRGDPEQYERIRSMRDGLRTARKTGDKKVLVMCRAGDFIHLYLRNLAGQAVDIDTMDALKLLKCDPQENPVELPAGLNSVLTTVKLW